MGSTAARQVGRRWVLRQTGRGVVAFAVLGLIACSDDSGSSSPTASTTTSEPTTAPTATPSGGLRWSRVDLGFVAAYVLVRGGEAAVVDTGVAGSETAIGTVLDEAGPGWAGVRHVVLTHKHRDHAGSIGEVMQQASRATGYVGQEDLSAVTSSRALRPLNDGDEVFGLQIVGTPGHTAGHVAVFDADTGVLVAGDALRNDGGLAGSSPQFTEDAAAAADSVRTMARLKPRTILVGHGAPVTDGAADALDELARSLG